MVGSYEEEMVSVYCAILINLTSLSLPSCLFAFSFLCFTLSLLTTPPPLSELIITFNKQELWTAFSEQQIVYIPPLGTFIPVISALAVCQRRDLALHMAGGTRRVRTRGLRREESHVRTKLNVIETRGESKQRDQRGGKQQEAHWGKLLLSFPH